MKKILVIGATGMLGVPVVKELLAAGFQITAMVRNLQKARALLPPEVILYKGDLKNPLDVELALEGMEGLYLNLSVQPWQSINDFHTENEGLRTLLPLAKAAGISRLGYLSPLVKNHKGVQGFSWWVFDMKEAAIQLIKESGIPYTLFYPSIFMENFDKGGYVKGSSIQLAGTSKHPLHFIAGQDYGKVVARAFLQTQCANKEYTIQGPEALTVDEAARVFAVHYRKKKLKIVKAPLGMIRLMGLVGEKWRYLAKSSEAFNEYPEQFDGHTTWQELGKPELTLKDYAANA